MIKIPIYLLSLCMTVFSFIKYSQHKRMEFFFLLVIYFFFVFITKAFCNVNDSTKKEVSKYNKFKYFFLVYSILILVVGIMCKIVIKMQLGTTGIYFMDYLIFLLMGMSCSSYQVFSLFYLIGIEEGE